MSSQNNWKERYEGPSFKKKLKKLVSIIFKKIGRELKHFGYWIQYHPFETTLLVFMICLAFTIMMIKIIGG